LKQTSWNNSTVIGRNVAEEVSKVKAMPGKDILVDGSAQLVHTLVQYNLIDVYRLMVYPVILGKGKRLFNDGSDMHALRLIEAKQVGSGIFTLVYHLEQKQ
jgi:dihydrofolate reductase